MVTIWYIREGFHRHETCSMQKGTFSTFIESSLLPGKQSSERSQDGPPVSQTLVLSLGLRVQAAESQRGLFLMLLFQTIAPSLAPSKTGPPTVYFLDSDVPNSERFPGNRASPSSKRI